MLQLILLDTVLELMMTVTLVTTDMDLPVSATSMAIPAPITPFIMDRGAGHLDFEGIEKRTHPPTISV